MNQKITLSQRILRPIAQAIIRLLGWKLVLTLPPVPKFVLVGAPHTSNWDFFFTMLMVYGGNLRLNYIAKDSLFGWPLGRFMRWMGGIPVNRREKTNFVQQVIDIFARHDHLIIALAPEGTRSRTPYWKTGFYYIATGAQVPIALGFVDYPSKTFGIGPQFFYPSGDLQADFELIKAFYLTKTGKYPHRQGPIQLRPDV